MARRPTVLCVDDQASNLKIRTLLLEQFGCNAIGVADGPSALRAVSAREIDLVVIDYHLAHGENGEDVARGVRARRPNLPLIMLTGDNRLAESASAVVDAVLIKGTSNPVALLELINKLVPDAELRHPQSTLAS